MRWQRAACETRLSSRKRRTSPIRCDARREGAIADDAGIANVSARVAAPRERDVEPIGWQRAGGAVRPFQQNDRRLGQIVEAELREFGCAAEPVEIGVDEGEARQLVILNEREGRARHLDGFVAGEQANYRARVGCLTKTPSQRLALVGCAKIVDAIKRWRRVLRFDSTSRVASFCKGVRLTARLFHCLFTYTEKKGGRN